MAVGVTRSYRGNSRVQQDVSFIEADATLTTFTSAGVGAVPVSATGKYICFVTVASLTGAGATVVTKLQHSVDNVNWADVPSGADSARTTNGVFSFSVAGPVARFVRAVATKSGTYTTGTVSVAAYVTNQ